MSPMEFMLQNTNKIIGVYRKTGSQKETYQAVSNLPGCPLFNSFKTYLKPVIELSSGYEKIITKERNKIAVKDAAINRLQSEVEGLEGMFEEIRVEKNGLELELSQVRSANKEFLKERDQTVKKLERSANENTERHKKEKEELEGQLAKVSKVDDIPKSIEGWTIREDVRKGPNGKLLYLQANITRKNKRYSIYIGRKDSFNFDAATKKILDKAAKTLSDK